ncbi:DMT family transporter [Ruegeria arenilitoris]|uniref:DMT family transporter n=1 Tax=Ruegeria arenilitoris TaxID=1173585 RepID=UPI00147AE207|nr:DMT family transporter [Ruegeria arenilitoris]
MRKGISDRSALLFVVLAPLLWAGNFIVGRALHGTIEPFDLNYLRWFVAAITLLPVIILNWRDILLSYKRHMPELIVLASFGIVLFNWLLYVGLKQTPASVSGLIFGLSPIIILIIARIWRGRRLDLLEIVGGLVAFGGVGMVLFTYADMTSGFSLLTGPIFVLFAALAWALFTVCLNRLRLPLAPTPCMAAVVWCGLCLMTPLAVWRGNLTVPNVLVPEILASGLYLGVGASVVAFCAWSTGVRQLGAARAGVFLQLTPFFIVVMTAVFLGEEVSSRKMLGLMLLLVGIGMVNVGATKVPGNPNRAG